MRFVDYIESTGEQYIDTGVIPGVNIDVELTVSFHREYSGWRWLYAANRVNALDAYGVGINSLSTTTYQRGATFHDDSFSFQQGGAKYTVKTAGTTLYINGSVVCSLRNDTFTSPTSMGLLGCRSSENGVYEMIPARLYSCKIWDGSTLVRDFVPAVDNGTPGLYDRVTGTFFGNSGTGEFLYPKWIMTADGLTNPDFLPLPTVMAEPFPSQYWRLVDNKLSTDLTIDGGYIGAFANCINLMNVSVPPTVKKIGKYAFYNTQLTSVTIASDCVYYDTSFPDGCVVNFYPD